MSKFLVELYYWKNSGLEKTTKKLDDARKAFDFAYNQVGWNVVKIFNNEDELVHVNSTNKEYESYA